MLARPRLIFRAWRAQVRATVVSRRREALRAALVLRGPLLAVTTHEILGLCRAVAEQLEPLPQPEPPLPLTPEDYGSLHAASRAAAVAGVRVVHTEAVLLLRAASAAAEANVVRATHRAAAMVWRPWP